jgi:WD40 repeat protein
MNSENPPEYILIYDYLTGELLQTIESRDLKKAVFSPDGSKLAVISTHNNNRVWYYNTTDWSELNLGSHSHNVTDIAFSPDGTKIATCGLEGYIKIWDVYEQEEDYKFDYSLSYQNFISIMFAENDLLLVGTQNNLVNYFYFFDLIEKKELTKTETRRAIDFDVNLENDDLIIADYDYLNLFSLQNILSVVPIYQPILNIFPNPNSSTSKINLNTIQTGRIEISILNQAGIEIESIYSDILEEGEHNFNWDGSTYPSGVYYCRITGKNINETLKIILEK